MPKQQTPPLPKPGRYKFDFTKGQIEEIQSLPGGFFDSLTNNTRMFRVKWIAVAYMCRGKAQSIKDGRFDPEDEPGENKRWIEDLEDVADIIESFFGPGDGKI